MQTSSGTKFNTFAEDVLKGLSSNPKALSSKYFYDDEGSRLFQEIMKLPEYYLTRTETEIFERQKREIVAAFRQAEKTAIDLIELGAGDGTKTAVLIAEMLAEKLDFTFAPIDISAAAIESLTEKFAVRFPALNIKAQHGDYLRVLETLKNETPDRTKKIVLFLGSNIGNFSAEETRFFFKKLRSNLNPNDFALVGFDLQKDPRLILRAYDDAKGITAKFNLNLLTRINRELGGDFDVAKFSHYALYHPAEGVARSFLISLERQQVFIEKFNQSFDFEKWETVFMEISQKYTLSMIEEIAANASFRVVRNFTDENGFYTDSLWQAV